MNRSAILLFLAFGFLFLEQSAIAFGVRGNLRMEESIFLRTSPDSKQKQNYFSIALEPEFHESWSDGDQSLTFTPFYRWDQHDSKRSHGDLRELSWLYLGKSFEVTLGVSKVFWGAVESQYLVDVINQTDFVENPDGEDKLGQPMVSGKITTRWGNFEVFVLPFFRERTFPGENGRFRSPLVVDTESDALYESPFKDKHIDMATRWSQSFSGLDLGIHYFSGTNREPKFIPTLKPSGDLVLLPKYDLIRQGGMDAQFAAGAWLWKLECLHREGGDLAFNASTAGSEFTFYSIFDSSVDAGLVTEYSYDSRQERATTPLQNDVFLGLRLSPNDAQDTQFLFGIFQDLEHETTISRVEISWRVLDSLKGSFEAGLFENLKSTQPLYIFRNDDYAKLELAYYF